MMQVNAKYQDSTTKLPFDKEGELGDLTQKLIDTFHLLVYEIERVQLVRGETTLFTLGDDEHPYRMKLSDLSLTGDETFIVTPANKEDRNNQFVDLLITYQRVKEDEKMAQEMQRQMYYSDGNGEYGDVYNRLLDGGMPRIPGLSRMRVMRIPLPPRTGLPTPSGVPTNAVPTTDVPSTAVPPLVAAAAPPVVPGTETGTEPVTATATATDAPSPPGETTTTAPTFTSPFDMLFQGQGGSVGTAISQIMNNPAFGQGGVNYTFTETMPDMTTFTAELEVEPIDEDDSDLDNLPDLEDEEDEDTTTTGGPTVPLMPVPPASPPPPATTTAATAGSGMPDLTAGASRYNRIVDLLSAIGGIGTGAPAPTGPLPVPTTLPQQTPMQTRLQNIQTIMSYLGGPGVGGATTTLGGGFGGIMGGLGGMMPRGFAEPVRVTLTEEEFNALPEFIYKDVKDSAPSVSCAICMCDYDDDETVLQLPTCKHLFHKDCIGKWLKESSTKCPVCKESVANGRANL